MARALFSASERSDTTPQILPCPEYKVAEAVGHDTEAADIEKERPLPDDATMQRALARASNIPRYDHEGREAYLQGLPFTD